MSKIRDFLLSVDGGAELLAEERRIVDESEAAARRDATLRIIRRDLTLMNWHRVPDEKVLAVATAMWGRRFRARQRGE